MIKNVELSDIQVELDVGNLCVTNLIRLDSSNKGNYTEDSLKYIAAVGTQKLLNEIFKLPSQYHEHVPVAKLPEPLTVIPREKRVPQPKPETKWEKFAKEKGIQRRKKEKLVWDENSKDWKPRFGYRGINNQKDWLIEVPETGDPNADYFGKEKEEKKERIAKNEYQRLRNIATASKMKVTNLESVDQADKHQLSRSLSAAKTATASLGHFTQKLPKEKPPKNSMKKRKFKPNIQKTCEEKGNNLKIFESLEKKRPKLNVQEAVQKYINKPVKEGHSEEQRQSSRKRKTTKHNRFKKNTFRSGGKNNFRSGGKNTFKSGGKNSK